MSRLPSYALGLFLLLSGTLPVRAQFSYIYIQGDKETPFYVKREGKMMPRYGKNYNILSELAPGPVHLEILFEQRKYPPEKFTIVVPEKGSRGFLLSRKDNIYVLYDLQDNKFINPEDSTTQTDTK